MRLHEMRFAFDGRTVSACTRSVTRFPRATCLPMMRRVGVEVLGMKFDGFRHSRVRSTNLFRRSSRSGYANACRKNPECQRRGCPASNTTAPLVKVRKRCSPAQRPPRIDAAQTVTEPRRGAEPFVVFSRTGAYSCHRSSCSPMRHDRLPPVAGAGAHSPPPRPGVLILNMHERNEVCRLRAVHAERRYRQNKASRPESGRSPSAHIGSATEPMRCSEMRSPMVSTQDLEMRMGRRAHCCANFHRRNSARTHVASMGARSSSARV